MYVCAQHACLVPIAARNKRALDPPGLKLQRVIRCPVDTVQTRVFWESCQCS